VNKNYDYFYSNVLGQKYAIHKKTGQVTFQDNVKYNLNEIEILKTIPDTEKKNYTSLKNYSPVRL